MNRKRIAPTLRGFVANPFDYGWRPDPDYADGGAPWAQAQRELRALLAVARAARDGWPTGYENLLPMRLALARLDKVSAKAEPCALARLDKVSGKGEP